MISDEDYVRTQEWLEESCAALIREGRDLAAFVERAERSLDLGPIFHPSEFVAGADALREVVAHARAMLEARSTVLAALSPQTREMAELMVVTLYGGDRG